jgi:hypothetical protein
MEIYLARAGQRIGPFPPDEIRRQLAAGTLAPTDLAWAEGAPGWTAVCSLLGLNPAGAPIAAQPPQIPGGTTVVIYNAGRTSGAAIASLVCGILSISIFPVLASIPAIIFGHLARREIRDSGGNLSGDGLAVAGLIMGYIFGGLFILVILMLLVPLGVGLVYGAFHAGK